VKISDVDGYYIAIYEDNTYDINCHVYNFDEILTVLEKYDLHKYQPLFKRAR